MTIKQLVKICHKIAIEKGFWSETCEYCCRKGKRQCILNQKLSNSSENCEPCNGKGNIRADRNNGELLMLAVSELAEALEALRKGDKKNFEEEIADTFIRLADLCGGRNIDIEKVINKKIKKNKKRPYKHGKAF